jgi:hypothetical protein
MANQATQRGALVLCAFATCALTPSCKRPDPGPDLQVVGETLHLRSTDRVPRTSPWFDGKRVTLVAARGETLGIQILHRGGGPVTLALPGAEVAGFDVLRVPAAHGSTEMYGGGRGPGDYPDELVAAAQPSTDPAYFTIRSQHDAQGELIVGTRHIPVVLHIAPIDMPPLPLDVWAYYDPRELGGTVIEPNAAERACIAMFAEHGVLLSPDMPPAAWAARKDLVPTKYVPAVIDGADDVRAWVAQAPDRDVFAIPIDEPRTPEARAKVIALAKTVRDAAGGKGFFYAVTDAPRPEYGDLIDLYISPKAAHFTGDAHRRWTYNGNPPEAGSMVLDAEPPGTRTWGWIAYRYRIPVWYVWDALYWHDRHNRKDEPPRALDPRRDATSFDDGDDHGNLDGVLALPGCHPTLRLEALRRGYEDRALLEAAAKCHPDETAALAARMIPRALGDAKGVAAWPRDEAVWEAARRQLLELASCANQLH